MARTASKVLTIAEKKALVSNLKAAAKAHKDESKKVDADLAAAKRVYDGVLKEAEAAVKAAEKSLATAVKAADKSAKDAKKAFDAASARHAKLTGAGAKGAEKIAQQLAEAEAAPTVSGKIEPQAKPVKAAKTKVKAEDGEQFQASA